MQLTEHLAAKNRTVFIPAHCYFELVSAVLCEFNNERKLLPIGKFKSSLPFQTFIVTIDERFTMDYLVAPANQGKIIDLKGGDMIFVAIALGLAITLITEDRRMGKKAKQLGFIALSISEYLAQCNAHLSAGIA